MQRRIVPKSVYVSTAVKGNGSATLLDRLTKGEKQILTFSVRGRTLRRAGRQLGESGYPRGCRLLLRSRRGVSICTRRRAISYVAFGLKCLPNKSRSITAETSDDGETIRDKLGLLGGNKLVALYVCDNKSAKCRRQSRVLTFVHRLSPRGCLIVLSRCTGQPGSPPVPILVVGLR